MSTHKLKKRPQFAGKIVLFIFAALVWSYLYYLSGNRTGMHSAADGICRYLIFFLATMLWIWGTYRCHFLTAVYCTTASYCLEHIAQRSAETVWRLLGISSGAAQKIILYGMILAVLAAGWVLLLRKGTYGEEEGEKQDKMMILLGLAVMLADIVLSLTMMEGYFLNGNIKIHAAQNACTILISILALVVASSRIRESTAQREKEMIRRILEQEQQNYQREKAVAEVINIKCHDLKYRISEMEDRIDAEELREIHRAVDEYESNLHTQNTALDVVLRNKVLICQQKGIDFICIADGKLLRGMKEQDIYAMFGNLLDNAIEAAGQMENPEMRVISLTVTRKEKFVFIHAENYYEGEIRFEDGLPQTRKDDGRCHGYGTRSVRSLAEKYGGNLQIHTDGNIFIADVMIPAADKAAG